VHKINNIVQTQEGGNPKVKEKIGQPGVHEARTTGPEKQITTL